MIAVYQEKRTEANLIALIVSLRLLMADCLYLVFQSSSTWTAVNPLPLITHFFLS